MTISKYFILSITFLSLRFASSDSIDDNFSQCFSSRTTTPDIVLSHESANYTSTLEALIRNKRFITSSTPKPSFIITPKHESHIQAAILCAKDHGMDLRTRSGGHDYEGLSYVSRDHKFVVIDLFNMRSVNIDTENESAWVEAGASLGELYYAIAKRSNAHGFNGGYSPTVGVGGHISGGGMGSLSRKYGLAADSVIDAKLINAEGKVLDRNSMGEDLFWAIRGGGAASFGVVVAWKVKLLPVPPTVTVFRVHRTLEEDGRKLLYKWQTIAPQLPKELHIMVTLSTIHVDSDAKNSTIRVTFNTLYQGDADNLVSLMHKTFPELGLKHEDCIEMSWAQSVLFHFYLTPNTTSLEALLDRRYRPDNFFKSKSDYVKEPIPESGLDGLFQLLLQVDSSTTTLLPFGGRISEISDSETPFPHRSGTLYQLECRVIWPKEERTPYFMEWSRNVHTYLEPYVSKSPRESSLNYRDLDLGRNNTSFDEASVWGIKYFKDNFKRLAQVKTAADPTNFFKSEQSIPLL